MQYSYKWLTKLIKHEIDPQKLADDLSCKSIEIENIERFGGDFLEQVVVGEIKEINPHPNADKLRVATVDIGTTQTFNVGERPDVERLENNLLTIVCGAPNIEVGQKVPVALIGTKLPGGEIKESEIRGVKSFGMLCAEDELRLGVDHSGILILDTSLNIGTKLSEIYNDWVFEGKVLANRGDLQSHVGVAKEASAIYGKYLDYEVEAIEDDGETLKDIEIINESAENCPYYSARMIKGVKIASSPIWMQQSLLACGMKPINNVVDTTNYVMLELGNPLHAFDANKLSKKVGKYKIEIRESKKGEKIRTLDGEDHELPEGVLLITDSESPIAVAGLMGGENSEISDQTTDIILEAACFNSKVIRFGQRKLGTITEASSRYAKGISPFLAELALDRAATLMKEICEGEIEAGIAYAGETAPESKRIICNTTRIREHLSIGISDDEILDILKNLDIEAEIEGQIMFCKAPPYRLDLKIWQDISEEIGRVYGLDSVNEEILDVEIVPNTKRDIFFDQSAKKQLKSIGMTEIFTSSILSRDVIEKALMPEYFFEISNPMNEVDRVMRSSLLPGIINTAAENAKKSEKFSIFDLSKVYLPGESEGNMDTEERRLAMLVFGEGDSDGLFVLRRYLDSFAMGFSINLHFEDMDEKYTADKGYIHPGRCADIFYDQEKIGEVFELHPIVLNNFGFKKRAWVAEISTELLLKHIDDVGDTFQEEDSNVVFKEFSRFEVSKRDLSIIIDDSFDNKEVQGVIKGVSELIIDVDLFDEYKSDKLGEGKKSLAYHISFQAPDRTLNSEEVDNIFKQIVEVLNKKYQAEIRG